MSISRCSSIVFTVKGRVGFVEDGKTFGTPHTLIMSGAWPPPAPSVMMPVLMFHGLDDQALLPGALNDTWEWLEQDLTLVTIPGAGHFVQQDASTLVTETMQWWLQR